MKKLFKRLCIVFVVLFALALIFFAVWVFVLFPYFAPDENEAEEVRMEMERLDEESALIDFNEEEGILYVNNEIIVFIKESASKTQIDALFDAYNAQIDDTMSDISVYKMIFPVPLTYEDLESVLKKIESDEIVEQAYINPVSGFDTDDAEDAEDDFIYQDAVYPLDDWNDDKWNTNVPRGENWGMEAIDAPGAWGYLDQMKTVNVGLIDTMPNLKHEDLRKNIGQRSQSLFLDEKTGKTSINKYKISEDDHGTHVSGIMCAEWSNGTGVSGVMGQKGSLHHCAVYYYNDGRISNKYATAYTYLLALKTLIDQDVQVINISQNTDRLIGFAASHGNQNAVNYLTLQAELTQNGLLRIISQREGEEKPDFVICVAAGNSNNTYYYKDKKEPYGYRQKRTRSGVC